MKKYTCKKVYYQFTLIWILAFGLGLANPQFLGSQENSKDLAKEAWWVHPEFDNRKPRVVAVLPMINMSFESDLQNVLQREVYNRLKSKGYQKIAEDTVEVLMKKLGIQTAEQLAGISYSRLGTELGCDAVVQGQVDQSATQHTGVYEAVVVSISLRLIDCQKGEVLWKGEQWRTAHRQWHLDPFNMLLSAIVHEQANKDTRIAWLVQEMLRSLPQGPVEIVDGNLFDQAETVTMQSSNNKKTEKSDKNKEGQ